MRILNEFKHIFSLFDCNDGAKKIQYAPKFTIQTEGKISEDVTGNRKHQ